MVTTDEVVVVVTIKVVGGSMNVTRTVTGGITNLSDPCCCLTFVGMPVVGDRVVNGTPVDETKEEEVVSEDTDDEEVVSETPVIGASWLLMKTAEAAAMTKTAESTTL